MHGVTAGVLSTWVLASSAPGGVDVPCRMGIGSADVDPADRRTLAQRFAP